eukprot:COSAG02_NODE_48206_length_335_cov_0.953390_1_plen_30_part_10
MTHLQFLLSKLHRAANAEHRRPAQRGEEAR